MTMRTRTKRATFIQPFVLKGLEGVQPSGPYSVETREEPAGFFSFLRVKRTSTWIRVCRNHGVSGIHRTVNIDALNLATALTRDSVPE